MLLHAPSFAFQAPGGGENQLIQTGRHLEELGVRSGSFPPGPTGSRRPGCSISSGCRARGSSWRGWRKCAEVPVVLSPICWYEPPRPGRARTDLVAKAREPGGLGPAARIAPGIPSWRRELLRLADLVLPNSRSEAAQFVRLFGVARERIRVVPNGVLPSSLGVSRAVSRAVAERIRSSSPSAGSSRARIRSGLIRAVRPLGLPLVVIGEAAPGFGVMQQDCRRAGGDRSSGWAGSTITIRCWPRPTRRPGSSPCRAGSRRPDWPRSRRRSPGCPIVITPYGSTREYFGDLVEYARPDRVGRNRRAVAKCWEDGPDPRLARWIANRLSLAEGGPDHRGGL